MPIVLTQHLSVQHRQMSLPGSFTIRQIIHINIMYSMSREVISIESCHLASKGIPNMMTGRCYDCLIFIMGILYRVRQRVPVHTNNLRVYVPY